MNIMQLYKKYKDVLPYLFFGVCTTVVNVISYYVMAHLLSMEIILSTILAWLIAVLFAFFTNRKWVFHSKATRKEEILKELGSFFSCRLATGCLDWLCMFVFVDILSFNDIVIKIAANILVIVLNYLASKLIIFKKRPE